MPSRRSSKRETSSGEQGFRWLPLARVSDKDPFFSFVRLLLHMDGANNSTTFTNSVNNGVTVTPTGNVKISTDQSKAGGASAYFDGTGDLLTATNSLMQLNLGQDCTWECWVRPARVTSYNAIFVSSGANGSGDPRVYIFNSKLILYISTVVITHATTLSVDTWYHVAAVRANGVWRLFVDGTMSTGSSNYSNATTTTMRIGSDGYGGQEYSGYMDEVRLTHGTARYTASFTPPVPPFRDY